MLTQERLKQLFDYNPLSGVFVRKAHCCSGPAKGPAQRWAGKPAGAICVYGYCLINVDNVKYRRARLAFLYMTGEWPSTHVDHINGNPADDRWENLRLATREQNMANTKVRLDNTSGARGVSWNARKGLWHVRVTTNGRTTHGGYFADFDKAVIRRDELALKLHGEFARLIENEAQL